MLDKFTTTLKNAEISDLYDISLASSAARDKEVFIFEKSDMSALFDQNRAEEIRKNFLENGVKVKQISNSPTIPKFSENSDFINQVMTFRYIPSSVYEINHEVLVFDDTVAVYNSSQMMIIQDPAFAKNYKQLFQAIWDLGHSPKLEFDYKPNHSFYNNLNFFLDGIQIIVWPDADAKVAYSGMAPTDLEAYILDVIKSDTDYKTASYIIVFMWSFDGDRMLDVWMFNDNHVDDRSGPLGDAKVYREGKIVKDLGIASGNTLLVLGYEEKLRRQSSTLKTYLDGPPPKLPLEILNEKDFFSE